MAKIIIMVGLPASGKSTKAEEILRTHGNVVRINKDLLRTMLHFNVFSGRNEGLTREAARVLAKTYLSEGMNVVIDDTNLNPGTVQGWKDLARELGAKVEMVDMTDVPVEECVMRDNAREKQVGGVVIKNMALRYGLKGRPQKGYVLCDLDGTIADINHRLHFVKNVEKKDWKGFFGAIPEDTVRSEVQSELIRLYNEGYTIIFMSARPEDYRDMTLKWIKDHFLSFAWTLIMRSKGDKRPDSEVKLDMLNMYFPNREDIHLIIDDRPSVIRMWREQGLNVLDVGHGVEF